MPTLSKDERDRLSLAARTIGDVTVHMSPQSADCEALELARKDLLDLLHEAEAAEPEERRQSYTRALGHALHANTHRRGASAVYRTPAGMYRARYYDATAASREGLALVWAPDASEAMPPESEGLTLDQCRELAAWYVATYGMPEEAKA